MARRKRQSTAEDIMDLVARLPWWAGVALALASYVFFHWFAGRPQPKLTGPGQVADVLSFVMVGGLAKGLQYVAPMLCLVGAAISAVRRRKRAGLVASVTGAKSADAFGLLHQAKAGAPASRPASASPTARTPANPVAAAAPECPKCSGPMVQRTAKKGGTPGAQFWGCSRFPVCYGVRNQPA